MHFRAILPGIGDSFLGLVQKDVDSWVSPGTTVDVVNLRTGTASIESEYDEALCAPGILERVAEANRDNVDGIFVDCFGDPAVHAAREISDVPVTGGFEPAVLTALSCGEKAGIVTVLDNPVPMIKSLARRYSISDRIGAYGVIDMPVLGLEDHDMMTTRITEQSIEMLKKREADVIILGCTGMLGVTEQVRINLHAAGYKVPVIDPTGAAIAWLESSVKLNLFPSRVTYMTPTTKERTYSYVSQDLAPAPASTL